MDSPVSAFAMYKAKNQIKKTTTKRDKKKKKKASISPKPLPQNSNENVIKNIAHKVKRKQKKVKETKNIIKKKTHKKKKLKVSKKVEESVNIKESNKFKPSETEHVPALVPITSDERFNLQDNEDDICSNSTEGGVVLTSALTDSCEEGLKVFKWMIAPYNVNEFFKNIWEKKPLHIARNKPKYYYDLITTPLIDNMLRNENVQFTKNVDVTSYVDGKRETHNPVGRALPHLVWDFYLNGCSVRLLNPQTYMPKLHLLNATLQEYFNSFVGANAYLTPPDSQGFAPHYDDIEAFILQTEGKKHWRIYKPQTENDLLPRVSSKNFSEDEIGEPILEVTLEAGDMLYFPRGYIHQGVTIEGEHSLHVTISMYQKHSWGDLFERMVPAALQIAISENVDFRKGLPFDIYDNFGLVHSDMNTPRKIEIEEMIKNLFYQIKNHLPMDEAVDQMCKKYQHDALPPVLSDIEKACTVYGDTDVMVENGKVTNRVEIGLDTKIRLLRKNILRMVSEDGIRLYYYTENSLEYHGNDLSYLEIEEDLAPAIETLITTYPNYVAVENLEAPDDSDKIQIADALWGRGLIMTEYPLETIFDD
ncbi:bifunctional lysine-specific demethylase and histidyl-hydroxylase NO66 [Battus philenor]|uniref:bifunctional lysine-specific demethylase and histidyl-hydroxylase NO66 n=1 Tax=Battus philenor TaxID=42288 RepID=UPI0035CFC50D